MLQGLDYWIWAMAHRKELAEHLNRTLGVALPATPPVMLDFVVAEKAGEIVSPYTAAQLEVLDGSIPWQVYRFDGWDHDNASISSFGRRRVPPKPTSVAWPRFAVRLESDLVTRADTALHRRVFFAESGAGVFDAAKPGLEALRQRVVAHRYADHVRSSQAFALNLFAGLPEPVLGSLWQLIDPTGPPRMASSSNTSTPTTPSASCNRPARTRPKSTCSCAADDQTALATSH